MGNPKVTILMSVFNGEKFLREAVESILSQTFMDFEFLIIDDGSTDNSVEIINSYSDPRIRLVRNETNIGLTKSLNIGLRLARGEYVARMDADDVSLPHRLEKQIHLMAENLNLAVCGSWIETISDVPTIWRTKENDSEIKANLLFHNDIVHPSVVIRRKILLENDMFYNENMKTAQDYELWARLSNISNLRNIPEVLLKRRIHTNQIGKMYPQDQKINANIARQEILKNIGIDTDDFDLKLHLRASEVNIDGTREFFDKSLLQFERILNANKEAGFVSGIYLEKILANKVWMICSKYSHFGMYAWRKFRDTPLRKFSGLSFYEEFKFFIRCLIKYKVL